MRKLSLIILSLYLSLLWTPLALAADGTATAKEIQTEYGQGSLCEVENKEGNTINGFNITQGITEAMESASSEGEDTPSRSKVIQQLKNEYSSDWAAFHSGMLENEKCGEPSGGFYEKGACKDEIVTEVTETFAPETKNSDGQIIDLYSGLCCLIYEENSRGDYVCHESRTIYTQTFEKCNANAILCEKRQWIIGKSGAGIIKLYVKQIYSWGAGTAGFIAVIVIIVSGIQIQLSGVSGDISQAKDRILQSISGLVLIFLSGIILYTINPEFFS